MRVIITKSNNKNKKYKAIFYDKDKKIKTIHFGASGYSDYTLHKNINRKKLYLGRHKNNENWNNYMSAGALSRWILWNKPTIRASIIDYKKRFNLN